MSPGGKKDNPMAPKNVPLSKFQELKGLDRISQVVHEMQCIWREISKDDIGIDGEIDVLEPRPDGKGAIATGKIIKVQAKSGLSYVKQDTDESFSTPVSKDDLELWVNANYPVLFIVYHPGEDKLYWKDVKDYAKRTPNIFQPPIKIIFEKRHDEFSAISQNRVLQIANISTPRIQFQKQERLLSNLFLLQRSPKALWNTPVLTNLDYGMINSILRGRNVFIPPFSVYRGRVYSFGNLSEPNCSLREFCDVTEILNNDAQTWWNDPDLNQSYVSMMNRLLRVHAYRSGIRYNQQFKRFFFPREGETKDSVKKTWVNQRTKSKATRTVAAYYEYGNNHFWRHLAADMRFKYIGSSWFLQIIPKYLFTTDGQTIWDTEKVGPYTTRQKARERNPHVLNHILFWADWLSGDGGRIEISLNYSPIMVIEKMPQIGFADFAITDDPAIYEEPPEAKQPNFFSQLFQREDEDFEENDIEEIPNDQD
jgi:hypothetical protein